MDLEADPSAPNRVTAGWSLCSWSLCFLNGKMRIIIKKKIIISLCSYFMLNVMHYSKCFI